MAGSTRGEMSTSHSIGRISSWARPSGRFIYYSVNFGTANALGGIMNAARSNVPMLFSAGRNPITEFDHSGSRDRPIHWAQEAFDQVARHQPVG